MPVNINRKLAGVLYIGPFRPKMAAFPPGTLVRNRRSRGLERFATQKNMLAEINYAESERLLNMARLLVFKLSFIVEGQLKEDTTAKSRKELIENFIAGNFKKNISLSELAEFLLLSASRTTQLLRDEFGKGFPALVMEERLSYASSLLANSGLSGSAVAAQCGFGDAAYFFRVFKNKTGMTPRQYRQLHPAKKTD